MAEELAADFVRVVADCAATGRRPSRDERTALRQLGTAAAENGTSARTLTRDLLAAVEAAWPVLTRPGRDQLPATVSDERRASQAMVALVREVLDVVLDGHDTAEQESFARDEQSRHEFVADLLHGRTDLGRLASRAEGLGVRLASAHFVIVARHTASGVEGFPAGLAHRLDLVMSERFGSHNILVSEKDGGLVCIAAGGLRGVPGELNHQLVADLGSDQRWRLAVGRAHPGPSGVVQSHEEAVDALRLADRLDYTAPLLHADDLLVFRVLLRDREAMEDLVSRVLGPLTNARSGSQVLLDTLRVFFDSQGNITATARRLGMSARAVSYRLDRVEQLTGYSATEPTQRFTLEAAVLGARLLDDTSP